MNSIHRERLPTTEEQLRLDLLEWREITLAHSKTEGIAAPFPKYEMLYFLEDNFVVEEEEEEEIAALPTPVPPTYSELRAAEYPDYRLYLDGIVKGDKKQIQSYIDACLATKSKYPKGE